MIIFLDTDEGKHHIFVCLSVWEQFLSVVNRWQDVAGSFACSGDPAQPHNTHTHSPTHTQLGPSEYIVSLQRTEGFPYSSVINGRVEAGAKMKGGPVCSPLMR